MARFRRCASGENVGMGLDFLYTSLRCRSLCQWKALSRGISSAKIRWCLSLDAAPKVPIFDGCGNITKSYGSSIDIDDRKRAEEKLVKRRTGEGQDIKVDVRWALWRLTPFLFNEEGYGLHRGYHCCVPKCHKGISGVKRHYRFQGEAWNDDKNDGLVANLCHLP
jgi:hypothetical protein